MAKLWIESGRLSTDSFIPRILLAPRRRVHGERYRHPNQGEVGPETGNRRGTQALSRKQHLLRPARWRITMSNCRLLSVLTLHHDYDASRTHISLRHRDDLPGRPHDQCRHCRGPVRAGGHDPVARRTRPGEFGHSFSFIPGGAYTHERAVPASA